MGIFAVAVVAADFCRVLFLCRKNSVDTRSEEQVCNSPSSPLIKKPFYFSSAKKTFLYSFFVQLRNVPELLPKIFWQSSTSPHLLLSDKKIRSAEEEGEGEQQGSDQLWLSSKKPFLPVLFPPQPLPTLFISPPPSYSQPIKPSEGPIETPSRVGLEVFKIFPFFPGELIIFCGRPRCGGRILLPENLRGGFSFSFPPLWPIWEVGV